MRRLPIAQPSFLPDVSDGQEPGKVCAGCKIRKTRSEFYKMKQAKCGLQKQCKTCCRERLRKNRADFKASGKMSYGQRCHWRLKLAVIMHYSGGSCACACCNEKMFEFLSIDHIGGGGGKHRQELRREGNTIYKWLKRHGFPEGFRVLCHNCNQAMGTWGYCPHQGRPEKQASFMDEIGHGSGFDPAKPSLRGRHAKASAGWTGR